MPTMWRWAGRADREQGEGCDLSGMWQKYKIIDYQRWHLSDLLQQATFHFFANSAASCLSYGYGKLAEVRGSQP